VGPLVCRSIRQGQRIVDYIRSPGGYNTRGYAPPSRLEEYSFYRIQQLYTYPDSSNPLADSALSGRSLAVSQRDGSCHRTLQSSVQCPQSGK